MMKCSRCPSCGRNKRSAFVNSSGVCDECNGGRAPKRLPVPSLVAVPCPSCGKANHIGVRAVDVTCWNCDSKIR